MKPFVLFFVMAVMAVAGIGIGSDRALAQKALPNGFKMAITQQINSISKTKPGTVDTMIELVTIVQHPARVKMGKILAPSGIKVLGMRPSPKQTPCPNVAKPGTTCKQRFEIKLDANKNCRLNGQYAIQLSMVCLPGQGSNCKLAQSAVPFKLASENFCEEKSVTVPKK
jgi:hypothetical protein